MLGPNLQGKVVSAPRRQRVHPKAEQESNFFLGNLADLDSERGHLGSFSVRFEGDDYKKVVNFCGEEKCTPDKNLATPRPMHNKLA